MSGETSPASSSSAAGIARQIAVLPFVLVLGPVSIPLRHLWRRLLHSYVEEYDSYGLNTLAMAVTGVAAGLVVWLACWFLLRRPRALLAGQLVTLLMVPIGASAWQIDEALSHPAGDHDAEVAQRAAADRAAELGANAFDHDLPAWWGRLAGGATAWFPPVAEGKGITWRGAVFPAAGVPPDATEPLRGHQIVVVSASPGALLVLAEHDGDSPGALDLVDIPLHGPKQVVAGSVTGAAAAPDGHGYAYSTEQGVTARLDGAAKPVVLPRGGVVVQGWGSDGVVLQEEADGTLLRWHPDRPEQAPVTLVISTSAVQVPPRGHRMLQRACLLPYDTGGVTRYGKPAPSVGFNGGAWPVTLPAQVGGRARACRPGQQSVLSAGGMIETPAQGALALSPDGRYLLLPGLQVLDLDHSTRTGLVDAATRDALLVIENGFESDPIGAGFWHDDRSVEVTAGGRPIAVCTLPAGPCRSTGVAPPRIS